MEAPADFKAFFLSLSADEQRRLAKGAGTKLGNIRAHRIHARRIPKSREAMNRLHEACTAAGAKFTKQELLAFFYAEKAA
jgi:hypothetical protein